MAQIEMLGLRKSYGADTVVDGIDLEVADGQFVVLLGPSGCGKTTTLRMIAGLDKINSGELRFDGRLMNDEPPDRRGVGMVFQHYALYPHMTVAGNLSFGLESRRGRGSRRAAKTYERARVREVAALLELEHVLDHRPKELSGGQRQRVALGRALIREPDVFLLDEPLSNLDANLRERMRMELARLHEAVPVTTVYVTHDQGEALTLAEVLVVMHEGKIRQSGPPGEVYDRPADTFVAGFLGSPGMNLLPVDPGAGAPPPVRLPPTASSSLTQGKGVTFGIRPEHLELCSAGTLTLATVTCRVHMVENLGSHLLVHASLPPPAEHAIVAHLEPGVPLRRGEEITLGAQESNVHLFDGLSGRRLGGHEARERVAVTV